MRTSTINKLRLALIALAVVTVQTIAPATAMAQPAAQPCAAATDASGFSADVSRVVVVVPAEADLAMERVATTIVGRLREVYPPATVEIARRLAPNELAVMTERNVVIDDDVAVPGEPQWFSHDPTTVFLHWTTAVADLDELLNQPAVPACRPTSQGLSATWHLAEDESEVLRGYSDKVSYDLSLPTGWQVVEGANLTTKVTASATARSNMSVRFDLDGRPLATWTPEDKNDLEVAIPGERFTNQFELEALTTTPIINEDICFDAGHVGRWIDIGQPVVRARIRPSELDVARAVSGLGPVSNLTARPLVMALPSDLRPETLEVAGAVVAALGHHGAPIGWDVIEGSVPTGRSGVQIIPGPAPASVHVEVERDEVVLRLEGDETGLIEIAKALNDSARLLFFHDQVVRAGELPAQRQTLPPEVFRFDEAGYDDRTLRGKGAKSLVYRIHIPAGVPPDSATLALFGTYAPALADTDATVSIRINGSEEQIVAVLDPSGQMEVLHTITPANLRPGLNYVKVTVQLGDGGEGRCAASDSRWFTVSSWSALGAANDRGPQEVRLGVEDARFALAASSDFGSADIVIADEPDAAQLGAAFGLIGQLSSRAQGGAPRLVTDAQADTTRHLVLVGAARDRRLFQDIPYIDTDVGVVAAIPSPHSPGRVLLAFTGGTPQAAQLAIDHGLSAAVNGRASPFALVSVDTVRGLPSERSNVPTSLAYDDSDQATAPSGQEYETWLLDQAARIEAATAPATDTRRMVAIGALLLVGGASGLAWIRRSRRADVGAAH